MCRLRTDRLIAMAGAAALGAGLLCALHAHAANVGGTPTLGMEQRVSFERQRELPTCTTRQFQARLKLSERPYRDSPWARNFDGRNTLENAMKVIALSVVQYR